MSQERKEKFLRAAKISRKFARKSIERQGVFGNLAHTAADLTGLAFIVDHGVKGLNSIVMGDLETAGKRFLVGASYALALEVAHKWEAHLQRTFADKKQSSEGSQN